MTAECNSFGQSILLSGSGTSPYSRSSCLPLGAVLKPVGELLNYLIGRGYTLIPTVSPRPLTPSWEWTSNAVYRFGLINRASESSYLHFINRIHYIEITGNLDYSAQITGTATIDDGETFETSLPFAVDLTSNRVGIYILQYMLRTDLHDEITLTISATDAVALESYGCFEMPRASISEVENHGVNLAAFGRNAPIYHAANDQYSISRLFDSVPKECSRRVLFTWGNLYSGGAYREYPTTTGTSWVNVFAHPPQIVARSLDGAATSTVKWKFFGAAESGQTIVARLSINGVTSELTVNGAGVTVPAWSAVGNAVVPTEDLTTADGRRGSTSYDCDVQFKSGASGHEARFLGVTISEG